MFRMASGWWMFGVSSHAGPTLVPRLRACRGHPRCFAATRRREAEFGGHGPRTTGAFFELLGYRPGVLFAVIAGLTEAGGGVMLAVGLLTPLAGAAVVGVMLNAASTLRGRGPWVINGGWEYTVVLATVGASIGLTGPRSISADHARGLDWSTAWGGGGVALGVTGALAVLVLRRPTPAQPEATSHDDPLGEAA
jgi:putative oxidoreductase